MKGDLGVYVHVPFCARVCPYCDFAVEAAPELLRGGDEAFRAREDRYVAALLAELELRAPAFAGLPLATLYFGGGTPGLLRPESLARIRGAVTARFEPGGDAVEVTLEINPSTVERDRLSAFHGESGVNRLSIGVQSFDDSLLEALGRAHRADELHRTLAASRSAGFENVSIDLMFAALHQTPAMLERDLEAVRAFAPEHVSSYELVHEPHTPFGRAAEKGRLQRFDDDTSAEMMLRIEMSLGEAGYERYELTNFAKPGRASRHNQRYWARAPVLALGVGAHSTEPAVSGRPHGARRANPRGLADWLALLETGEAPAESLEVLDAGQARGEACFLALRTAAGLSAATFEGEFGAPPRRFFEAEIAGLVERGLLAESERGDLVLTARGRMLADEATAAFV